MFRAIDLEHLADRHHFRGREQYHHPHEDVLGRIAETGSAVRRMDESGTIELASDGSQIWALVERGQIVIP